MADNITKQQRRYCMQRVKSKNTQPEMAVRKLIFSMGYRYRIHSKELPGHPDIFFPSKKKAIFIHGCYWHRHRCKHGHSTPATNKVYWLEKFNRTVERDKSNQLLIRKMGWSTFVVWECQLKKGILVKNIKNFLNST